MNQLDFSHRSIDDFIRETASNAPVPGGGGASALVGAIGVALGNMVGSLTVGKKKYAAVEEEMQALKAEADALQQKLLALIDADAEVFLPLSKAYKMPSGTDAEKAAKTAVTEQALDACCRVPLEIMQCCGKAIELHKVFAEKGSVLAVSDAGVGAICCKSALQGAALNVYINTRIMQDRDKAAAYNTEAAALLEKYTALADEIYHAVAMQLEGSK